MQWVLSPVAPLSMQMHFITAAREKHFPFELILKALQLEVEKAQASIDADRIHILNAYYEVRFYGVHWMG